VYYPPLSFIGEVMSNTNAGNVIRVDTSAAFAAVRSVAAVKYIGATNGTATITSGTSGSGSKLWEESGSANQAVDEICIHDADGIYVTVTNSAVVYLYLGGD
jgi:hypothetical protein